MPKKMKKSKKKKKHKLKKLPPLKNIPQQEVKTLHFAGFKLPAMRKLNPGHSKSIKPQFKGSVFEKKSLLKRIFKRKK